MQNRFPVRLARILGGLQATAAPDPSEGSPVGGSQPSGSPIAAEVVPEYPGKGEPFPDPSGGEAIDETESTNEDEAEHDCPEDEDD